MQQQYEREISESQAGFRRDSGTRDQILNLKLVSKKAYEYNKTLYCCFIDYTKAFDCVDFSRIWNGLASVGIPPYLVNCLQSLYRGQKAKIETPVGTSEPLSIGRGLIRGIATAASGSCWTGFRRI